MRADRCVRHLPLLDSTCATRQVLRRWVDCLHLHGGVKWRLMKPPPPSTVTLRHSRIAYAAVVFAYGATASLLGILPGSTSTHVVGAVIVIAASAWVLRGLQRQAGIAVSVALDRTISVTRGGHVEGQGTVLSDSYVGAWVTTIVWRPDASCLPRVLLVVRDAVEPDAFRRLRVALLYGSPRPAVVQMSVVEAG